VLWKPIETKDAVADAPEPAVEGDRRLLARAFHVFNADQVDGWTAPLVPNLPESERIAAAEAFVAAIPANITHGGDSAYYIPALDQVRMPAFGQFARALDYYATLAHELTHWTGAKPRLDRDLSGRFGSDAYAMEELVAELGAAFTAGRLGLPSVPRADHAPYIANWLKVLKGDSRAIFTAAARAQQAADYLVAFAEPPA
jgi:antirestriction protein ArdC